jgi:hypothetical protein
MRADWLVVSEARRASGDWTADDEADIAHAIKVAIAAKDRNALACWSRWLADLSAWVTAWNLICRGSEASMKSAARAERLRQKGESGNG